MLQADAMFTMQFVIYPLEFLRTRMGVCAPGTYRSLPHAAAKIFREDGFLAFYRGMVPSMVRLIPFAPESSSTRL